MTDERKSDDSAPEQGHLRYDPREMARMRVLPADFARMCDVSRQTVSQWIRKGVITIGPDGRIDPRTASKELMRHSDLNRMRTRIFRTAMDDMTALRNQKVAADLKAERLAQERDYYRDEFAASICWCDRFLALVVEARATLFTLPETEYAEAVERLFYQAGEECQGAALPPEWLYEQQPDDSEAANGEGPSGGE